MRVVERAEGVAIEAEAYSIVLQAEPPVARVLDAHGDEWARLALVASLDTTSGLDDTAVAVMGSVAASGGSWRVAVEATSERWDRKTVELSGDERTVRVRARVEGTGELTDARLLGGDFSGDSRIGTGTFLSGHRFETVFSPEPADPARVCRSAREAAQIDASGGGRGPGSGHWFFTPPPFMFGFSRNATGTDAAPASSPDGPWLTIGVEAPVEAQTFTAFRYEPDERAFSLLFRYEGQTRVRGEFVTPALAFDFGAADPYDGIARHSGELRRLGLAPARTPGDSVPEPGWWREPIFCGWGAQFRVHRRIGVPPQYMATEELYDQWLERLAEHGLVPGTIVLDDKWAAQYGTCEPDLERWPDLPGWIARRHEAGQRVLLWWKAWDPEGLPDELCVTNPAGLAIAADPSNPAYERELRGVVHRMLAAAPDGFDADGLEVDFTALTPRGPALRRHGDEWGIALLHRLLSIVADEARRTRADALIVAQTPNAAFADVANMIRLNDMDRFDEPDDPAAIVPQMLHRWRVARAACPDLLIDTDDWGPPSLAVWREYQRLKPSLGVPALYFVDGLDRSGEAFEEADYAMLRRIWDEARSGQRGGAEPRAAEVRADGEHRPLRVGGADA